MVISTGVIWAGIVLLGLSAFSAYCAYRFALGQFAAPGPGRRCLLLAASGVGLLALGFRLCRAAGNVSWAPYLDQWNVEISGIVAPLAHGTLGWRDLFAGNNEHRVFLTRALSLGAIIANGAWDNRVLVMASYLLESALVAWVCALAWSCLGWIRGSCVGAAALLPMLLVCDWESIVSSNQAQFVFMAFGSVAAFSLHRGRSLRSPEGWGPLAIALLTLGSMASGFLTAVALMATALVVACGGRRGLPTVAAYCAVCAAIAALGWLTRAQYPALHFLYAKSAGGWAGSFLAYAAWPLPGNAVGLLVLWLPWCALLCRMLRGRETEPFAPFALALGLWVLLQACALAWARSGLSGLVSSRYTEFLAWGFVANAAAIIIAFSGRTSAGGGRFARLAVTAIWLAGVGGFEVWRSHAIYRPYLEGSRSQTLEHEQRLGTFMRTGDAGVIENVSFPHIPHYSPDLIVSLLDDPGVRALLPGPLRRDYARDRDPSLLPSIQDGPLSLVAVRAMRNGPWFAGAGVILLVAAFLSGRRQTPEARPGAR